MKYINDSGKIFITLNRGDKINESLQNVAVKENLESGWIQGIGAMEDILVGYYDYPTRTYLEKSFDDEYELTGLTGNITLKDGIQFIHSHVTFSDKSFQVFGGHLFDATITAAGEFVIFPADLSIHRKFNDKIGLALWCLGDDNDE